MQEIISFLMFHLFKDLFFLFQFLSSFQQIATAPLKFFLNLKVIIDDIILFQMF